MKTMTLLVEKLTEFPRKVYTGKMEGNLLIPCNSAAEWETVNF